jgi:alkanesulfonate monooxygenase SsuD/methylene tetrahydromethanopterin reductase-like flavin-dependent oxidoreductase (luciferase family)
MTFGYLFDFRNPAPWRRPWAELYAETLDLVALTEELGFDGAWVPEHHTAEDGYVPSPLVLLSAIAARTRRMRIGTGVALAPLYHPVRFAEDCALVDILSNGRLEIALAVGYRRRETDAFGVGFSSRGSRTNEFLQIVRRLWAGETVTHESPHFSLRDAAIMPRPVRGHVPLYVGGSTERAFERAALYADGFHGRSFEGYLDKVRALGRDPAAARLLNVDLFVYVARDPEKARRELAPYLHYVNNVYGEWLAEDGPKWADGRTLYEPMSLEEFQANGPMRILTPAQAIAHFEEMLSRAPVEHFMMMVPPGLPAARFAEYAETFAKEVAPAFR